jgi:hypothetical protein
MVRWIVLGLLLLGLGMGFRNGWVEVDWSRMSRDLGLPDLSGSDPFGLNQGGGGDQPRQAR